MSKKIFIGIDIGTHGAIVIQNDPLKSITSLTMPFLSKELDISALSDILSCYKEDDEVLVIMENLKPIFGVSKSTDFSLGRQLGIIEGLCVSYKLSYIKVDPKDWQKKMFEGIQEIKKISSGKSKRDTKAMALVAAKRLFPSVDLIPSGCKIAHDGVVDALLLSEYGRK